MITYVIKSGSHYKIGRTKNLDKRFSQYLTHNPEASLYLTIAGDMESILRARYAHLRISPSHDWYALTHTELTELQTIALNSKTIPILPR